MNQTRQFFDFDEKLLRLAEQTEQDIRPAFERIESNAFQNQQKVLAAFIRNRVGENCFTSSTGYGYNDIGREKLERVFADAMECEDALLRHNFMCGTHALTVALFGVLRPGDKMLCVTGMPYDTIQAVIGRPAEEMANLLEGIQCRGGTSCPDQLSKAIRAYHD